MAEEESKKPILFQALLFLAVPALLYFIGHAYWDSYLKHFDLDMKEVQLPVYTVMFYSWEVLLSLFVIFFYLWVIYQAAEIKKDDITVPKSAIFIILAMLCFFISDLLWVYVSWVIGVTLLVIGLALLLVTRVYHRHFPEKKLTFTNTRPGIPLTYFAVVLFLYLAASLQGDKDAKRIIKGEWQEKSMVQFHFSSQQNPPLPDPLFLLISSDSYHYVLSPPDAPNRKPKIYAINKDMISHFEILPRDKQ